ncbi:hypothetical protein D0T53_12205 [Dysgonomonas sp. 216]|uniref:hypothetical protein n=1 Tax=Dysgonomonas sp. 216 TaxID=2302934 RepID=UPI0013D1FB56|nr:hypothetical protein [Dysgonomonas sp. 216]NDW19666.1 hypothetical protein [Dysgonomonas sp. 216]
MFKQYTKHIAENRNIIYPATFIALVLRGISFAATDNLHVSDGGLLWQFIDQIFTNEYISFVFGLLFTFGIALYVMFLSNKYSLIRVRSNFPYVLVLLLFSFSRDMAFMSPAYISVIILLRCLDILFDSYQVKLASWASFRIAFLLSIGSLFTPSLFLYVFIFWLGFLFMRSFNIKALLASLLGIFLVYWLAAMYSLTFNDINIIYSELLYTWNGMREVSIMQMYIDDVILLGLGMITILIILIDYLGNSYKDKIRVRANIMYLNLMGFLSITGYLFLNEHFQIWLMVTLVACSLSFAHFFALADKKWKMYFFIVATIVYFGVYTYAMLY